MAVQADPVIDPERRQRLLAIVDEINAHTSQPVVLFRPEIPQLMLLDKPGADTTRARR